MLSEEILLNWISVLGDVVSVVLWDKRPVLFDRIEVKPVKCLMVGLKVTLGEAYVIFWARYNHPCETFTAVIGKKREKNVAAIKHLDVKSLITGRICYAFKRKLCTKGRNKWNSSQTQMKSPWESLWNGEQFSLQLPTINIVSLFFPNAKPPRGVRYKNEGAGGTSFHLLVSDDETGEAVTSSGLIYNKSAITLQVKVFTQPFLCCQGKLSGWEKLWTIFNR